CGSGGQSAPSQPPNHSERKPRKDRKKSGSLQSVLSDDSTRNKAPKHRFRPDKKFRQPNSLRENPNTSRQRLSQQPACALPLELIGIKNSSGRARALRLLGVRILQWQRRVMER